MSLLSKIPVISIFIEEHHRCEKESGRIGDYLNNCARRLVGKEVEPYAISRNNRLAGAYFYE